MPHARKTFSLVDIDALPAEVEIGVSSAGLLGMALGD
jgi:hypothetical protein